MQPESQWPAHIKERYGLTKKSKLPFLIGLLVASIVGLGLGMANYRQVNPVIDWYILSFDVQSDKRVNVEWQIARQENRETYCVVRAQNEKRQDVGYATVVIPPGDAKTTATYGLNTESLAVIAEVLGCAYKKEMRVPPADFPPGVKIPVQDPPGFAPTSN